MVFDQGADGPLTSRLQHMQVGDEVITNTKAVGTLVMDNLKSGRNLYMLATGTGVAPFMSLVRASKPKNMKRSFCSGARVK